MAFNPNNAVLVSEGDPTGYIWEYNAGADDIATVKGAGYFVNMDAKRLFRRCDVIKIVASDGRFLATFANSVYSYMSGFGGDLWLILAEDVNNF